MTMFLDWEVKRIPCRPSLYGLDGLSGLRMSFFIHVTYSNTDVIPSFYTKHTPALPWRKCMLHYLYAEDLPQVVWIGLTTTIRKVYSSLMKQHQQRCRAPGYLFSARNSRALHVVLHLRATSGVHAAKRRDIREW